jgi:hypothetical protein
MCNHVKKLDEYFAQHLNALELKDVYMHLVIRRGIRYQEEWAAWCDEALDAIALRMRSRLGFLKTE